MEKLRKKGSPARYSERALVALRRSTVERLLVIAERDELSMSAVIRRAVDRDLAREDRAAKKTPSR